MGFKISTMIIIQRGAMKTLIIAAIVLAAYFSLPGQLNAQSSGSIVITAKPTEEEIRNLFVEVTIGQHDPFEVLAKIVARKDDAVPALEEFLFAKPTKEKVKDSIAAANPNILYGVLALEAIATRAAYKVLGRAVLTHPNNEVRGTALRTFALSYYYRTKSDTVVPEKEVVHLLLRNTEDTTFIDYCGKRIGEIAREGVKNWTGKNLGDLPKQKAKIRIGKDKKEMSVEESREEWWQRHSDKLAWNKKTKLFETQK